MTDPLLAVEGVSARFGGVTAVDGVSFDVSPGELLGLIGPNGAGKTTLLRLITGIVRANGGRVVLGGRDITSLPPARRARLGLALSHQIVRPFRNMTLIDNVMLAAGGELTVTPWRALCSLSRAGAAQEAHSKLGAVGIDGLEEKWPSSQPLGVLKRLEVARALATSPRVLLLDEPLAGLNPQEARRLADTIVALNRSGVTVVLIEHNLGEVLRICARLVVLDNGVKIADGAAGDVMLDSGVRAAYLGAQPLHA